MRVTEDSRRLPRDVVEISTFLYVLGIFGDTQNPSEHGPGLVTKGIPEAPANLKQSVVL